MIIVITLTKNCFELFTSAKAVCSQFLRQKTLGQSGKSTIFDQAITVQLIQAKIVYWYIWVKNRVGLVMTRSEGSRGYNMYLKTDYHIELCIGRIKLDVGKRCPKKRAKV